MSIKIDRRNQTLENWIQNKASTYEEAKYSRPGFNKLLKSILRPRQISKLRKPYSDKKDIEKEKQRSQYLFISEKILLLVNILNGKYVKEKSDKKYKNPNFSKALRIYLLSYKDLPYFCSTLEVDLQQIKKLYPLLSLAYEYKANHKIGRPRSVKDKESINHINYYFRKELENWWSKNHPHCINCGKKDYPHKAHGYCRSCYPKSIWHKKAYTESRLKNQH